MNDLLPEQSSLWQYLESTVARLAQGYGYREIRFPILESTELFRRSIGEVTDIVEKEMYTFGDRNDESITLRPEGTAGCVRACIQNGLLYNQVQRLWYRGPMFRYERPQKGRLRQFHQIGVEVFGLNGPDIDAELLMMSDRLWRELGIREQVTLQLNSLGNSTSRSKYRAELVSYLEQHRDRLDADSIRRLESNPLRILDSKSEQTRIIVENAPTLLEYLDTDSRDHFELVCKTLDQADIQYEINPFLVRGLDYYGKTVFEWVTDKLGAQGAVCAGGRYDGLVEQLGGKPAPAVGFGIGVERLALLLDAAHAVPDSVARQLDVYVLAAGEIGSAALELSEKLRTACSGLRVQNHCGGGSFKSQMKKADKSGAKIALIMGEDEAKTGQVTVKYLRRKIEQQTLSVPVAIELLLREFEVA